MRMVGQVEQFEAQPVARRLVLDTADHFGPVWVDEIVSENGEGVAGYGGCRDARVRFVSQRGSCFLDAFADGWTGRACMVNDAGGTRCGDARVFRHISERRTR